MAEAVSFPDEIHLVVGGYHYYLHVDDLLEHPDSYFAHMLKDEWTKDKTITLNRCGKMFRHVSYYLYTGYMDPNRKPIFDLDMLLALRTEADFYGLHALVGLCDDRIKYNIDSVINNQQNVGLSCDCVRATEGKMTDGLIKSMNIFRPPTVAISQVETFSNDSLESHYQDVADLLRRARESKFHSVDICSFAYKCFEVNKYGFKLSCNTYEMFSKWPLSVAKGRIHMSFEEEKVYIYETGGCCSNRLPTSLRGHCHGTYLYIFNSEHTGGRITTKVNGEEVSIEKPGECMALLPGCSYTVETVTSGHLVLFEYVVSLTSYSDDDETDTSCEAMECGVGSKRENKFERKSQRQDGEDERVGKKQCRENNGEGGERMEGNGGNNEGEEKSGGGKSGMESDEESEGELQSDNESEDRESTANSDLEIVNADSKKKPLVWQVRDSYSTEITPERSAALTQAINTALQTYAGVIICLSTYYPTGHSSNKNRRCETDPALLKKLDADLYAHLSTFYEVTAVTVTVNSAVSPDQNDDDESDYNDEEETDVSDDQKNDDEAYEVEGEDEVGEEEEGDEDEEEECTGSDCTARVLDFPSDVDMPLKVAAPMQKVNYAWDRNKTTLLTGLLCFARE